MEEVKKKWYIYLVLVIVMITYIVFIFNENSDNGTKLDEVELLDNENIISKELFAIMLGNEEGTYTESASNSWPNDGSYTYNEEKSSCIDINGKIIDNILSFDTTNYVVTISTSETVYCYLYFDKDPKPEIFIFYVGGESNPEYITNASTVVYFNWTDTDIAYYCVTNTQGSKNCEWQSTSDMSVTPSHTLTNGDGEKTVYAYIKDNNGNISEEVSDTILLDTTAPIVTSSLSGSQIIFSSNETGTYCINTISTATNFSSCTLSGSVTANTSITSSSITSKGVYYVHVQDAAGNIGISNSVALVTYICDTGTALGTCLKSAKTAGFNSNLEAGLYRYQGTTSNAVNNYVCFGTSNSSTCVNNASTYMYRVIGVNSSNQVKLIKNDSIGNLQWYTDGTTNITWPNSLIYSGINGSAFLTNTTYVPSGWSDKMATYSWKYGDITDINTTAAAVYNTENAWTSTANAKVGLVYVHDIFYGGVSGGENCSHERYSSTGEFCSGTWFTSSYNWTMSRYGTDGKTYFAYQYNSYLVGYYYLGLTYNSPIKPVFFLTTSVNYISGAGTADDPIIIS